MKTIAIREAVRRLRGMNLYTLAAQVDAEADTAVEVTQALLALGSDDGITTIWHTDACNEAGDGVSCPDSCKAARDALRLAGALP